jgi:hypothetical protein
VAEKSAAFVPVIDSPLPVKVRFPEPVLVSVSAIGALGVPSSWVVLKGWVYEVTTPLAFVVVTSVVPARLTCALGGSSIPITSMVPMTDWVAVENW